ncbi:DUF3305 domain-containing protein [Alphaproteobacteria bacterium]|jgi:hypothetical protein|nr:DUF3305 domain-containing protein [Alphaproteobacteria bacterium]MDC1134194.1 DUF3305 domain-containing protein [Alphaproteobacteria bacterium]|tara:strand:- start:38 stop:655 length:618 start_codon:yes stop_codon:yes gene_type:complete
MENLENQKHLLYAVRIILEKKVINNIWESHKWLVNDLIPLNVTSGSGYPPINDVRIFPLINDISVEDKSNNNLYVAEASIDLHRSEAEGYAENLQSSDPSVYIVLRDGDLSEDSSEINSKREDDIDIHLAEVSLSPYHIQDYEDCGEDRVEKVPLYGPIADLLEKFVEFHFHPEEFKKRKRDKKKIDSITKRGGDTRITNKKTLN